MHFLLSMGVGHVDGEKHLASDDTNLLICNHPRHEIITSAYNLDHLMTDGNIKTLHIFLFLFFPSPGLSAFSSVLGMESECIAL